jgi:predicted DNA-binding transcriptional regulator AlpA
MFSTDDNDDEGFLSRKQICAITGLSYPTLWTMMRNNGEFPLARCISKNRVGWLKSEVTEWIRGRPVQTYKTQPKDEA